MLIDDAIREATRLLASLRGMKAGAIEEAEELVATLEGEPTDDDLMGCAAVLEVIDEQLPRGTLAGLVRVRLKNLQGMVNVMLDDPPPAA